MTKEELEKATGQELIDERNYCGVYGYYGVYLDDVNAEMLKRFNRLADLEKENEQLTVSYETLKLHDEAEIRMLKSENVELKEYCNALDKSLITSTKNNIERQKIIDRLKEENTELKQKRVVKLVQSLIK